MKIWILQTGEPLQIDKSGLRPMRAINLSNELIKHGHDVTLWSSNFDHFSKSKRFPRAETIVFSNKLRIRLISSRGYRSHIGFGRLIDHAQLGWNLRKMLKSETPPDVAFIGYPPIEIAWIMSRWLNNSKVPFILDVKDAWPEILIQAFPKTLKPLARIFFSPYQKMFKDSLIRAKGISSITDQFLHWSLAQIQRDRSIDDIVVPLTSPDINFAESEVANSRAYWDELGVKENHQKRIFFVGTLNYLYDFDPVILAAREHGIHLVIAGDGPQRDELLQKTLTMDNVILPGWISSCQSVELAQRSTFAVAPIRSRGDFELSIPNKFIDAFRHGKPMLTSLKGISFDLIREHSAGLTFNHEDVRDLSIQLASVINDEKTIKEMSESARKLYLERFEFQNVYGKLILLLESMAEMRSRNGSC
jgi:glycosyltransferase involved in cell wall biosynthesis